jgi:putative ABC transport system permease protein
VLATLALGIGAATAIFSAVDAVLLKPLPFRDPEQLLVIWEKSPAHDRYRMFVARGNFWEWRGASRTIAGMAAIQGAHLNLTGGPNGHVEPEELKAERVSADLFPLLGVQPVVGRVFRPEEDLPGHTNFALLSHSLWQRRFGADRAIAGKAIRLRDQSYTVVGVLPAGFSVLDSDVDLWLPLGFNPGDTRAAGARVLTVIGRLKPGVSIEQAKSEMETIGDRLERASPAMNSGWRPSLFPIRDELAGKTRQPLLVLFAAVGCLLLISCANVANLLLARAATRRKEMAVRSALGAARSRIAAQLLSESIMLGLSGGAAGLVLAWAGVALVHRFAPATIPQLQAARVDGRVFLFALAVSLATGLLFGILPAMQTVGPHLNLALTESGRGGTASRAGRVARGVLVVIEVALAVVVLIGAGLLVRSFVGLRATNLGFRPDRVLTLRLPMAGGRNGAPDRRIALIHQVSDRLAVLPGVLSVGATSALPLIGLDVGATFSVQAQPAPPPDQRPMGLIRFVSGSYFGTLGIRLVAGRTFADSDTPEAPAAILVNQTLARRFFRGQNPLGQHVVLDTMPQRTVEVVGVAGDVKAEKVEGDDWPTIYVPYTQLPPATISMVVRTAGEPGPQAPSVERVVHEIDADLPVADVRPMEAIVDRAIAEPRFDTAVMVLLAVVAFMLAAVGIYGLISYDVNGRIHEIGIRMALGAQARDVLWLVVGQGARLAACGIAVGLAAAFALTRWMEAMLYGVNPRDFRTLAAVSLLLGLVALAASYLPSRRAMALDPMAALRHE